MEQLLKRKYKILKDISKYIRKKIFILHGYRREKKNSPEIKKSSVFKKIYFPKQKD